MFRNGFRLFRLWGIPVELNPSWLLVFALVTWSFATGYYPETFPGRFSDKVMWILALATALLLFASILLHEFSHSMVAVRNGLPIKKITLFMFGGIAQMEREVDEPNLELKMAAAGPAMTLLLAAIFYGFSLLLTGIPAVAVLFRSLASINAGVLIFNLVPGFPLDGGRILRAIIWRGTGDIRRATRITSRIGSVFAILLMLLGLLSFVLLDSLVGGLWLILIGFFLRQAARSGYLMVAFKEALGHFRVGDIMRRNAVTVESFINLRTLVDDFFLRYHYGSFPVLEEGRLAGIVSLRDVKGVERDRWGEVSVAEIMNTDVKFSVLHPDDSAETLLRKTMRGKMGLVPVVDEDARVIGVVTRRDIFEIINMSSLLRR